jgi:hypothetical protein
LLLHGCCNAVLFLSLSQLGLAGTAEPAEGYYYKGNQYESGNCILVHSLFVFFAEANIEYVRAHA